MQKDRLSTYNVLLCNRRQSCSCLVPLKCWYLYLLSFTDASKPRFLLIPDMLDTLKCFVKLSRWTYIGILLPRLCCCIEADNLMENETQRFEVLENFVYCVCCQVSTISLCLIVILCFLDANQIWWRLTPCCVTSLMVIPTQHVHLNSCDQHV